MMTEAKQEGIAESESAASDAKAESLSARLAHVEVPPAEPAPAEAGATMRLARSHFVSPAGRMVIGSRATAPKLSDAEIKAAIKQHALFSSASEGQRRGFAGGTAALFVCALAVGTTAGLAALLESPSGEGGQSAHAAKSGPAAHHQATASVVTEATPPQEERRQLVAAIAPTPAPAPVAAQPEATVQLVAQTETAELVIGEVHGDTGSPAPLEITANYDSRGEYAFLMFRGIKDGFRLSTGFRLKESWAVSLRDLSGLQLVPPPGYRGSYDVEVLLVKGRGTAVESRRVTVSFGPRQVETPKQPVLVTAEAAPVPHILTSAPPMADITEAKPRPQPQPKAASVLTDPPKAKLTMSVEEETRMLDRAFNFLRDGDISSARLLLEHLARKGSGKGAMVLGQTFDPMFFRSMNTLGGMKPDSDKARQWYQMAANLGLPGAQERIDGLSAE